MIHKESKTFAYKEIVIVFSFTNEREEQEDNTNSFSIL